MGYVSRAVARVEALVSRPRSGTFVSRRSSFPSGPLQEEEGGTEKKKDRRVIFRRPSLQQLEVETRGKPCICQTFCSLAWSAVWESAKARRITIKVLVLRKRLPTKR